MKSLLTLITTTGLLLIAGCSDKTASPTDPAANSSAQEGHDADDGHTHEGGHDADDGHVHASDEADTDHAHEEVSIGTLDIGDLSIQLAQGHGALAAGKEAHLVVKLPYNDSGSTVVRAWIGSEDRTLSFVGKGEYASAHDEYDVHANAPDPLPADAQWWVELVKPDGTKLLGSVQPLK